MSTHWAWKTTALNDAGGGLDPYLAWARLTEFRGFEVVGVAPPRRAVQRTDSPSQGSPRVSVIVELAPDQRPGDLLGLLEMPPIYNSWPPPRWSQAPRFVTGRLDLRDCDELLGKVKAFEIGIPRLPAALPVQGQPDPEVDASATAVPAIGGPGVMVGVIDDGCAFLREEFADADGRTRIIALWDQGHDPTQGWAATPGFAYGRVLDRAAIDALRAEARTEQAQIDAYADLQYMRSRGEPQPRASHGTSVLGLAAATHDPAALSGQAGEAAPNIVFVHLPDDVSRDTSGGGLPVHLLDGIRYILSCARDDQPVVINISYGALAGPHDGTSLIEQAMDDILQCRPGTAIVVAAGNGGDVGCQAQRSVRPGGNARLTWQVQDGDGTDSFCEIWWRGQNSAALSVEVHAPRGFGGIPTSGRVGTGQMCSLYGSNDAAHDERVAIASIIHAAKVPNGEGPLVLLALSGTDASRAPGNAPFGEWRITLRNEDKQGQAVEFCAYIERDGCPPAPRGGKQSRFVDLKTDRVGTLSNIATGKLTIVVGACSELDPSPPDNGRPVALEYSGSGPSRGPRMGPDVLAPGERAGSGYLRSVPFVGVTPSVISRTSAAAAVATRWIANWLGSQYRRGNLPAAEAIQQSVRGVVQDTKLPPPWDPANGFRRIP
jgi:hypothetical protein